MLHSVGEEGGEYSSVGSGGGADAVFPWEMRKKLNHRWKVTWFEDIYEGFFQVRDARKPLNQVALPAWGL